MNAITTPAATMTSREIAELTGKEHKNVLADIRKMLAEIHSAEIPAQYKDSTGRTLPMLILDKEQTLCLVSGYDTKTRMAIIRRWQELEQSALPRIPQTYAEALRLCADQAEQIEAARPAIAFAERHANAPGLISFRAAAKMLKFKEHDFIAALLRDGFIFRDQAGRIMPYADKQHGGLMDCVAGEANGHAYMQTKITTAGLQKLADRYASELGE